MLSDSHRKTFPHIKFILPNAPLRTVGVPIAGAPGETILPAWWDPRLSAGIPDVWTGRSTPIGDEAGLLEARTTVNALLDAEAKLVAPGRIVVVGFSQGAGLALAVGLEDERVDGVIGESFLFFLLPSWGRAKEALSISEMWECTH